MTGYAALYCMSNFSFLEGASHPEELIDEAHRLGLCALALTDRDGVYGVVKAHEKARALGFPFIVGATVTLGPKTRLVLLCENRAGYAALCGLITQGRLRAKKGECLLTVEEICAGATGLLLLVPSDAELGEAAWQMLREAFGDRAYALVLRHLRAEEREAEARLRARARRFDLPVVAGTRVLYHARHRRPVQDVLTAIRHGVPLAAAGRRLCPNAEHDLKPPAAMAQLFADDPEALVRTVTLATRAQFSLSELRYRYPAERLPSGMTTFDRLRALVFAGARTRYGEALPESVQHQLERELSLIQELDYCGYFLTMREIVEFCQARDILCQGRGSAANSAVCYCLEITAVDPVRMGLLFERFISRERAEPPDIDLDIEHDRREEVIQHVYEKYGRTHAAMVANVIRYQARSAVRDVGKALGLPPDVLERAVRGMDWIDEQPQARRKEAGNVRPDTAETKAIAQLYRLAQEVQGFPRHLSIHPGGFLLGHDPVASLVPIENAALPGRTVIQWDKDDVEALGLFKVDLLGLGALNHLHRAFTLIERHHGERLSLATIPPKDEATFDAICKADTIGVFQIESRAQMAMLPRLRPRNYYDLVIQISLVRPGPITGGMVHPYLRRRQGLESPEYPHPSLRPVLEKTLGVPLFQEQVMALAMVAADYTPGEADQLRRDMAAWRQSGRIERHRERLITRMCKKGIAPAFAERVFEQIRGFGEYGFPESHAASFALLSYAGAYLKRHYPAAFLCALLNAQPMGFYSAATLVEDGKRHGVELRPIDVLHSDWDCTLEPRTPAPSELEKGGDATRFAVRMGLRYVLGLNAGEAAQLLRARAEAPFRSVEDVVRRTGLGKKPLRLLSTAGAFEGLGLSRRAALWQTQGLVRAPKLPLPVDWDPAPFFHTLSPASEVSWDYEASAHSTRGHPLRALRAELRRQGLPSAEELGQMRDGARVRYAGLVICRQRPGTASGVVFMTLEDETGFVNAVLWRDVFERFTALARLQSFLGITGRLQVQDGVVHLVAEALWPPRVADGLGAHGASRDFH